MLCPDKLTLLQRRTGARPPPPPAGSAPKAKPDSTVPAKRPLEKSTSTAKSESKTEEPKHRASPASDSQSSSKAASKPAAPRREKSDLFSSFAKAKPKQKTSTPAGSVSCDMAFPMLGLFAKSGNRRNQVVHKMVCCSGSKHGNHY